MSTKVAIVCINANADKKRNIDIATNYIREAAKNGANWICLPEMMSFHGPYSEIYSAAETEDGPLNQHLAKLARELSVTIFAGSVCERSNDSPTKVYNTQYVFSRSSGLVAKYRKIHLFNLLGADGSKLYCESDGYLSGKDFVTFELDGYKIALATCYDLRFPEMFIRLAKSRYDVLLAPSAFTQQTGIHHWELLVRSRAVENLSYVIAPNQTGTHSPGKISYGHGLVVDPWGKVLCDTGEQPGLAYAEISKETVQKCRNQLPALDNKRTDLY